MALLQKNKMFFPTLAVFFLLISSHFQLLSQNSYKKSYPFYIKGIYASGHIGEHGKDVSQMSRGFTNGIDLMFNNLIRLNSKMDDRPKSVFLDLGFHYVKYPYDYLGECYAISLGKSGHIFNYRRFGLFAQFTMGLGYDTNPFSQTNNKNLGMASHLGFVAHADFSATYPIYKDFSVLLGIGYNHLSNGSIKRPNLGFNVLSTNIGLTYQVNKKTIEIPENMQYRSRKYFYHIIGTYFRTSNGSFDGETYPAYNFHTQVERYLSKHHSLLLSVDYNRDMKVQYPEQKDPENPNKNDYDYLGVSIGGNWKYSIIDMDLTVGAYVLHPWHQSKRQYSLLHFKVYATKHAYFIVGLKAHVFQADVFETGIGIKI